MTKEESETRTDAVLAEMRGGPIASVSPERSRDIIAAALRKAAEDERCSPKPESIAGRSLEPVRCSTCDGVGACPWMQGQPRCDDCNGTGVR